MSQKAWSDFEQLPVEAKRQVEDFVAFLLSRNKRRTGSPTRKSATNLLEEEPFVGMWQDRDDLEDSSTWVRGVRNREWSH
jgi:hypothetical protein